MRARSRSSAMWRGSASRSSSGLYRHFGRWTQPSLVVVLPRGGARRPTCRPPRSRRASPARRPSLRARRRARRRRRRRLRRCSRARVPTCGSARARSASRGSRSGSRLSSTAHTLSTPRAHRVHGTLLSLCLSRHSSSSSSTPARSRLYASTYIYNDIRHLSLHKWHLSSRCHPQHAPRDDLRSAQRAHLGGGGGAVPGPEPILNIHPLDW
mmetsp:Transcript_49625/g.160314  ORF Transcript_49625/g.160314 Transcript_49625/m.160314 type:complete len:211 (-) Transcript_49625:2023-2655(-)